MSVIDASLRVSQATSMLTADAIREELIRALDAREVSGVVVAAALGVAPARVTEMRKRERQVQQREMEPLANLLRMAEANRVAGEQALTSNARTVAMEGASLESAPENLQVWGSALGAAREVDGEAIEQTTLNSGEVIEYVKRPAILKGKALAYALYVQGSSMHPALPDGEMAVAVKDAPLAIGDNVVVYLRPDEPDFDDGERSRAVLVKELVRRTARYVELRQYQPPKDFRVDMADVLRIDRILTRREMLS